MKYVRKIPYVMIEIILILLQAIMLIPILIFGAGYVIFNALFEYIQNASRNTASDSKETPYKENDNGFEEQGEYV